MILVNENLYRGPRPKSFADLQPHGITTVINLQSGMHEQVKDDKYERELASDFGMSEINIACSDVSPPSEWQVDKFLGVVRHLTGPFYVHCLRGKDRTGYMVAAYRMRVQGWSFKDAVKEMKEYGFHTWPYLWWIPSLKKYEAGRGK